MAFAPDGRLFVTERGTQAGGIGKVRVIKNGSLLSTPFVSIPVDNVTISANERGLLGLAFDPNFVSNHFIYVYYTVPGSPPHNRISRFTANGDVAVSGSEKQILNLNNLQDGNHNGGPLHFGLDGKLYVGVGENHNASNATNLSNYLGKILRINADGTAPSDNPFFNSGDGINSRDRIWAFGMRNPFTFAVHPTSGRIFVNDVGENTWEEIDDLVKGKDFGWRGGTTDGDSTAFFKYGHDLGKAIAGGTFYQPPSAPGGFSNFLGRYFFSDYTGGFVRALNVSTKSVSVFDTGLSGPVDLDVGSDGNLYVLTHNGGEVWKVVSTTTATQSIMVSTNRMQVNEASSGSFTVRLAAQPSSNVTVNLARTAGSSTITFSPTSLTFTSSNWSTTQKVTVNAADDGDAITQSAAITCSASGLSSQKVAVDNVDNDGTGPKTLVTLPNEGDVVRGKSAEFYGGSNLDGSTAKGEFFIDNVLKFTDTGTGHYHFNGSHASFDTTTIAEGGHLLKLVIFDTSGRTGTHQVDATVDNLPSPWNHLDIGAVGATGSAMQSSGTFTVEGSGADIFGSTDEFHFVRKKLSGDGEIRARVTGVENTNVWAKAGVMIRETLTGGSKHAHMLLSAGGATAFQFRNSTGGTSASMAGANATPPKWVRVRRSGSTFTGFTSSDGSTWTTVGSTSITMATDTFIGLAVTSHNDGTLCTGTFTNVTTSGTTTAFLADDEGGDPDPTVDAPPDLDTTTNEVDDGTVKQGCGGATVSRGRSSALQAAIALALGGLAMVRRRRRR